MISIMFTVYGEPVAKGRPRFSTRGKFPIAYTPEKTKTYESEVGMMAKKHLSIYLCINLKQYGITKNHLLKRL